MPEGSKYDSVTESLKLTQSGYNLAVSNATSEIQKESDRPIFDLSKQELNKRAKNYAANHEWFDGFTDGAEYGAIVEFSEVSPNALTTWQTYTDTMKALRAMAEEAFKTDITNRLFELKDSI